MKAERPRRPVHDRLVENRAMSFIPTASGTPNLLGLLLDKVSDTRLPDGCLGWSEWTTLILCSTTHQMKLSLANPRYLIRNIVVFSRLECQRPEDPMGATDQTCKVSTGDPASDKWPITLIIFSRPGRRNRRVIFHKVTQSGLTRLM